MKRNLIVRPVAEADVDGAADHIAADTPSAGERFLTAANDVIALLTRMPELGRLRDYTSLRLENVRSFPISGFENWLIFYRPLPDGIEVIRVLHGARDVATILEQEEPGADLNESP